ncbi:MAG: hypothetical protein MR469_06175 [Campylobacter sp.]|uniref:hypothetical protein n=1 Tax=Campylobacter sp. TaxID=205 RepID=UPI002AA753A6|nr:hypothetical protein [Campylobacter sp.]MCI6695212.1 hypothetical protein [Campylobacter sp.]MCI6818804.1 hypothetical protein [Campylobacter sp.]
MSIDLLIMISLALLILAGLAWGWMTIQGLQNKLSNHTKSFDKLMQINYQLNKELSELKKELNSVAMMTASSRSGVAFSLEEISRRIDARINEALASRVMPMLESLRRLESSVDDFTNEHEERMLDLEERTKSIGKITPPSFSAEEDKIESLFNAGKSAEEIARDMHITLGKVNMVLRLRKLI